MSPRQTPATFPTNRAHELAAALTRSVSGEVRFDDGSRALYATDASNYRQTPIGVVIPRTVDDVVATVAACREYDAPVLPRGGGTSLAGQCCNVAVVIDTSKYLRDVVELDPARRRARVQPGCVLDHLRDAAERYHLTFGPDPATHDHNTLGGMLGNNSCGVHSVMAGRTSDNVHSLDVLCYDGTRMTVGPTPEQELESIIAAGGRRGAIYAGLRSLRDRYADLIRKRFPHIPRRVSGFGLDELLPENGFHVARALVGTEASCVTILEAELQLVPSPSSRVLLMLGFPDVYSAADAVPRVMETHPIGVEGLDRRLIDHMRRKHLHADDAELLPQGAGWLMVEMGADTYQEAVEHAKQAEATLTAGEHAPSARLLCSHEQQAKLWELREAGLGATAFVPGQADTWTGWEDSAVPPDRLGDYLRDFRKLLLRYQYEGAFYGHFGQGILHTRITFDLQSEPGVRKWRAFLDDAADLVVRYGGSLSGEHGDGQQRARLLSKMYGEELVQAFREFKALWDPLGRMNPGKAIDSYPITSDLRLRAPEVPLVPRAQFAYRQDHGSFAHAALRCVGVGECRRTSGGLMCPSYMVTREEKHSTRGRARLLFEMMHEGALRKGWHSDAVHDALDLCLACKGCKHDCPVNVDMATYKAEFHAHYYKGRLRPRSAYAFGLIYWWARAASHMPQLVNAVSQSRWGGSALKTMADIAEPRRLPRFAVRPFTSAYTKEAPERGERPVLLWPDTFNNFLDPDTLHAAVEVLRAAGYTPIVPHRRLCCGRPLYAWGWVQRARRLLLQVLREVDHWIAADVPLVGLEPACVSALRDELLELFPADDRAQRLARNTWLLSEFLERADYEPPRFEERAVVHLHCHHRSVLNADAESAVLKRLGMQFDVLDSGCCGMAGEFGFEARHYAVSRQAGERVLFPAIRAASPETLIIADGFSCREQIRQETPRQALHLSQVLRAAHRH